MDGQEKDVTISLLESKINEHQMVSEKVEKELAIKETIVSEMRTKLVAMETELANFRKESKLVRVPEVDANKQSVLKKELDSANERIKELEISHEVLKEKKTRLEMEFAATNEKYRVVENSERSLTSRQTELEETSKRSQTELTKVLK